MIATKPNIGFMVNWKPPTKNPNLVKGYYVHYRLSADTTFRTVSFDVLLVHDLHFCNMQKSPQNVLWRETSLWKGEGSLWPFSGSNNLTYI